MRSINRICELSFFLTQLILICGDYSVRRPARFDDDLSDEESSTVCLSKAKGAKS